VIILVILGEGRGINSERESPGDAVKEISENERLGARGHDSN
jgi:hypothetical protein